MTSTPRLGLPEPQSSDPMSSTPPAIATIWSNVDGAIGPTFCTSTTKPATPYACQWIYQTDLNAEQIWDPIASAWVTIKPNPTGIVAVTTTVNNTSIAAASTEYQVAILNNIAIEPFRNYKVHVEGICGFTFNGTQTMAQPTQTSEVFIRYANAASVNLTGTQLGLFGVDASQSGFGYTQTGGLPVFAQQDFAVDSIYSGTAATQLSVLWSFKVASASFTANTSAQFAQNTLMYVEQV